MRPLAGLRVLELGTFVSAPYCGKLFAGYGADVIKVEPPGGDIARAHGPFLNGVPNPETSALFLYLNTGKRSVELDVGEPAGLDALFRLAATCDVVIENSRPADLRAMGITYEALRAVNPAITLVSITAFGQNGPYAGYRSSNLTAFAMGGQMFITGTPEGGPLKGTGYQADYQGGLNAFSAAMVALLAAARDGEGQHVDVSAQRCMAPILEAGIPHYTYLGEWAPERKGNHMTSYIGIFPCKDGHVGVHVMPRNWKPFTDAIERPDLATDARFATSEARIENSDDLMEELRGWAATVEKRTIYERAGRMRAPISFVHTMQDLLESPQLTSRGFLQRIAHPVAGEAAYPGPPWSMGPDAWTAERAPLLGEHTTDVLRELARAPAAPEPMARPGGPSAPLSHSRVGEGLGVRARGRPAANVPAQDSGLPSAQDTELPPSGLAGLRVIDLSMVWAGPFGARLLGDYGAEVIKVESPTQWDLLRALGRQPREEPRWYNRADYFNHNNRNKLGIALDLQKEEGRRVLLELCRVSDVLVENYRADVMQNLRLTYEDVRSVNPRLIYVSMPGHGKSGPEKGYVAYGSNVEQLSGLTSLNGYEGGEPMKMGFSYGDPMAGTALVGAVAMAVRRRSRTGEGGYVELAQRENMTMFVGEHLVDFSMNGVPRAPQGNRHPLFAPHNCYRSAGEDAWLTIACETDEQFAALCRAIEQPALLQEPRFATAAGRKTNEEELDALITVWTIGRGHYEAMHILQRFGVPAGAVLSIPELVSDPHLRAVGAWAAHTHPDAGTWEMETLPWQLSRTPGRFATPAPGFAEHNGHVFREILGLDDDQIAALYASGATADVPDQTLHQ